MSRDVTNPKLRLTPTFHFFAGLATGLLTASLLQPADLLKTRLQQPHRTGALLPTIRSILSGPDADGLRGLWRGTLPSLIRTGLGSALYFSSLNTLRSYFAIAQAGLGGRNAHNSSSSLPRLSKTANLLTGAAARAAAGFVLMPVTVVKVRFESSLYSYGSIVGACKEILKGEGVRGFFKGAGATAIRDAPYAGLYVVLYEEGKRGMCRLLEPGRHSVGEEAERIEERNMTSFKAGAINFSAGVLAAGAATALTNPFDAVKTRLQLVPRTYGNMFAAGRRMVKEEGWKSLMNGLGLRMGRKAVSSALAWTAYEELIRRAENSFGDRL